MDRLDAILRSLRIEPNISGDASGGSYNTEPGEPPCPICHGAGYLRRDLPVGHPDFGKPIACECTLRRHAERRRNSLRGLSNLGPLERHTFASFDPRGRRSRPDAPERYAEVLALAQRYAAAPAGWLVLSGPSGSGKTHLVAAIANAVLQRGEPVFFMIVADLIDHLRASFSPRSEVRYDDLFELVRTSPLLILDDFQLEDGSPWAREKLYQIINHRYNERTPTIITLRADPRDLEDRFRTRLTDPDLAQVITLGPTRPGLDERLSSMNLPLLRQMHFDNFEPRRHNLTADDQDNLVGAFELARAFAEQPEGWLVLLGGYGCGKTHLAAAIANYRLAQGDEVYFLVVPDLLDYLRSTFSPDSKVAYDALFDQIRRAPLLILDDLGTQSTSQWAQEKLFQLINYRYNAQLPTVITSNCTLDELEGRLASRLVDPGLSTVFAITAPDYRGDGLEPVARRPRDRRRGGWRG